MNKIFFAGVNIAINIMIGQNYQIACSGNSPFSEYFMYKVKKMYKEYIPLDNMEENANNLQNVVVSKYFSFKIGIFSLEHAKVTFLNSIKGKKGIVVVFSVGELNENYFIYHNMPLISSSLLLNILGKKILYLNSSKNVKSKVVLLAIEILWLVIKFFLKINFKK